LLQFEESSKICSCVPGFNFAQSLAVFYYITEKPCSSLWNSCKCSEFAWSWEKI